MNERPCNYLELSKADCSSEKNVRIPTTESTIDEDTPNDAASTPKVNGIDAGSDENLVSQPSVITNQLSRLSFNYDNLSLQLNRSDKFQFQL